MFLMQMRAIVLAFSCAASSLTLAAPVCRPAPPQTGEQGGGDAKPAGTVGETKEQDKKEKVANDSEAQSKTPQLRDLKGLGKEFLKDQEQIWTSPAKIRFSDTQWLVP